MFWMDVGTKSLAQEVNGGAKSLAPVANDNTAAAELNCSEFVIYYHTRRTYLTQVAHVKRAFDILIHLLLAIILLF